MMRERPPGSEGTKIDLGASSETTPSSCPWVDSTLIAYLILAIATAFLVLIMVYGSSKFYLNLPTGKPPPIVLFFGTLLTQIIVAYIAYRAVSLGGSIVTINLAFFLFNFLLILWAYSFFQRKNPRGAIGLHFASMIFYLWLIVQVGRLDKMLMWVLIILLVWYFYIGWWNISLRNIAYGTTATPTIVN